MFRLRYKSPHPILGKFLYCSSLLLWVINAPPMHTQEHTQAHMLAHTGRYTYADTHVYTHKHTDTYMHVHTIRRTQARTGTCTHTCTHEKAPKQAQVLPCAPLIEPLFLSYARPFGSPALWLQQESESESDVHFVCVVLLFNLNFILEYSWASQVVLP